MIRSSTACLRNKRYISMNEKVISLNDVNQILGTVWDGRDKNNKRKRMRNHGEKMTVYWWTIFFSNT